MKLFHLTLLSLLWLTGYGCEVSQLQGRSSVDSQSYSDEQVSLPTARRNFKTMLRRQEAAQDPVPQPPNALFRTVYYESSVGELAAYLSPPASDSQKHPAIIWIFGGFGNGIGETAWEEAPLENDQSASAFRKAGIVMMYPSLRGGNDNPGFKEGFFGEVDDVLAAVDYLAQQDFVDPKRIYLGGHSTGGTLALLVAASTDRFRAVFSFGPVEDVGVYGDQYLPFDTSHQRELELRSPLRWLHSIQSPVFVFEGAEQPGNLDSLQILANASRNPEIHFYPVKRADHFSVLAPATQLVADKILRDDGPNPNITFTQAELNTLFTR